jgi:hypothetical protein
MRSKTAIRYVFVAALAALPVLAACERRQAEAPAPPAAKAPSSPPPLQPPAPPPSAVDRAELLQAMDAAASAYAAGRTPESDGLAGRRFTVRQAFGCTGAAPPGDGAADGLARWSWGRERRSVEIRLTPSDWTGSALMAGGDGAWEAAEGFWLSRPWLRADGCPGAKADPLAGPSVAAPQSMGLAAVFEHGGSRLGRRNGRAYVHTVRGEGDRLPLPPAGGYRLVLEGRFAAFADGRAVRCRADGVDQRPVCVAAAQLDRVAFEDADGEVLSEWRAG